LIAFAYGLDPFRERARLVGPPWIDQERFDIVATGNHTSWQQVPQMLRALLTERFNVRVRTEKREQPVYALVVANSDGRLGPNLKPAAECDKRAQAMSAGAGGAVAPAVPSTALMPCGTRSMSDARASNLTAGAIRLADLARSLTVPAGRIVIDRTALTGTYNVELRYTRPNVQSAGQVSELPVLFTALTEQLGLKLEPQRAPVEVFVIDRVEPPTAN
jgi:uncharacterized protein (TIGR03435 family)